MSSLRCLVVSFYLCVFGSLSLGVAVSLFRWFVGYVVIGLVDAMCRCFCVSLCPCPVVGVFPRVVGSLRRWFVVSVLRCVGGVSLVGCVDVAL